MQIESRTSNLFECYAEMQLILCKDSNSFAILVIYIRKVFFLPYSSLG